MYENEKELLKRLCQKSNAARMTALKGELSNVRYENWNDMALVVPADADAVTVLCAHFDAVPESFGYNDNGMALVTALKLLHRLPADTEFVFTNGEERGGLGAEYYLAHTRKEIRACINLDVVGCFDCVYLDPMNCREALRLSNCKMGRMPFSDALVFADKGVPSVCFSSGPADTSFPEGIRAICSTLHNNINDNRFDMLNFAMPDRVAVAVESLMKILRKDEDCSERRMSVPPAFCG